MARNYQLSTAEIDTSHLAKGIYILQINDNQLKIKKE